MKPTNPIFTLLLWTSIALPMATISLSDSGIRGRVTDKKTGEPLPFANVACYLNDSLIAGTTSDFEGLYRLTAPPGIYKVVTTYVGYTSVTHEVLVPSRAMATCDILMEETSYTIDEIVVFSAKADVHAEASVSFSSIEVAEIAEIPGSSRVSRERKVPETASANTVAGMAGVLTAGRLNDFAKWDLWNGIADNEMKKWKEDWGFELQDRYTIQLNTRDGFPVADAVVKLKDGNGHLLHSARTDNTGKAESWPNIYQNSKLKNLSYEVTYQGKIYSSGKAMSFKRGMTRLELPVDCSPIRYADICFVVDATGSMGDELEYLKQELLDIILKTEAAFPDLQIRLSSVFYRDIGDQYITRSIDFTGNITEVTDFIKMQSAGGGGDYEEALHTALDEAVNKLKWTSDSASRMIFLVCDAPPHKETEGVTASLQKTIGLASSKGIRIIPIAGSGTNTSMEYLLRSFALATNGTYVFLTDHSGVGGTHLKPSTDSYDVMLLNELLQKILYEYIYMPSCNSNDPSIAADTVLVRNPKVIAVEKGQSKRKTKNNSIVADSLHSPAMDSLASMDSIRMAADTVSSEGGPEGIVSMRIYPNPTAGPITAEFIENIDVLFLADISGKLLERFNVTGKIMHIDLANYPSGVYYLQYMYQNKWRSGKIILAR